MAKSLVSCFFDSRCSFAAASQVFDVHVKNLDSSLQHNENCMFAKIYVQTTTS